MLQRADGFIVLEFLMVIEPHLYGFHVAIGQKVDHLTSLKVHDDGAVAVPFTPRPLIDTNKSRWRTDS
jgi:hypothetical protein